MRQSKKIKQAVGLRLKALREQAGYSMSKMAVRLHITPGTYSKNERGLNFPGLDTLGCLARDFYISMDWLHFQEYKLEKLEKKELEESSKKKTGTKTERLKP